MSDKRRAPAPCRKWATRNEFKSDALNSGSNASTAVASQVKRSPRLNVRAKLALPNAKKSPHFGGPRITGAESDGRLTPLSHHERPASAGLSLGWPCCHSLILVAIGFLEIALGEVSEHVSRLAIRGASGLD
jgi:hypothetical protein